MIMVLLSVQSLPILCTNRQSGSHHQQTNSFPFHFDFKINALHFLPETHFHSPVSTPKGIEWRVHSSQSVAYRIDFDMMGKRQTGSHNCKCQLRSFPSITFAWQSPQFNYAIRIVLRRIHLRSGRSLDWQPLSSSYAPIAVAIGCHQTETNWRWNTLPRAF